MLYKVKISRFCRSLLCLGSRQEEEEEEAAAVVVVLQSPVCL